MDTLLERYAQLVINTQLQLRPGDSLSINTDSSTITFARQLARLASEVTMEPVNIVETRQGRVLQVYPIQSDLADALRPPVKGVAMCHIVDLDNAPYYSEENPMDLAKEVVQLGNFGVLADPPELERRISAPWVNVPYPGPDWALQYLSNDATEGDMWNLFMRLFRLDASNPADFWQNQVGMINLRRKVMDKHLEETLSLSDKDWKLEAKVAKDTCWRGGETILPNGRKCVSSLPLEHIYASLDTTSTEGTFSSSKPFLLLGKLVKDTSFVIHEGKVTSWHAAQGKDALDAFFSVDEGARRVCEISLADEGTRESESLPTSAHPLFNKAASSHIGFGGFQTETLAKQFTQEELDNHHLGQSLVHLDVPIGSRTLKVEARDREGVSTTLVEEGAFVAL